MGLTKPRLHQLSNSVYKDSVLVVETNSINLSSPPATIDGVPLTVDCRVLVVGHSDARQNGIYQYTSTGTLVRTQSTNESTEIQSGLTVFVQEGTKYAKTSWTLTTTGPIILGTSPLTFRNNSKSSAYYNDIKPANPLIGDLWFDSLTTHELYIWTGSQWVSTY